MPSWRRSPGQEAVGDVVTSSFSWTLIATTGERFSDFAPYVASVNDAVIRLEEYDPTAGRLLGNFPQAFSHVGLVNTAHNLEHATKPSEQRSGQRAKPTA